MQCTMFDTQLLKQGIYRHYKGNEYRVIGVARHTETGEEFVVYTALYGNQDLYVRPIGMFTENIEVDGILIPRFTYLEDPEKRIG
jgi:hypothetical protein